mmetsp:Transcript_2876/g.4376  ORF Transcript_2876/g.4376 Transcript_2876/m.4376 type:complete len:499 (+) Transcript_2876:60-1556(+)
MSTSKETQGNSVFWAAVNLSKLSIGNGILALPYAAYKGGLLFSPMGIICIAVWNVMSCFLMISCKRHCEGTHYPKGVSSSYSRIAYSACGWWGVFFTDTAIVATLLGVCASYQIAFAQFLKDIPGNPLSVYPESAQTTGFIYLSFFVVYPLSCPKNIGVLSKTSFAGLMCLLISIGVLIAFGLSSYGDGFQETETELTMLPTSPSALTTFIGIAVFCFGLCTFAFPVEESMANRADFPRAVMWSMIFVCSFYVLMGDVLCLVYQYDPSGISGNILQNLPKHSTTAAVVRTALAMVCLVSFPLTMVPPAEMIEQMIIQSIRRWTRPSQPLVEEGGVSLPHYSSLTSESDVRQTELVEERHYTPEHFEEPSMMLRWSNRLFLVVMCTALAAHVPCFGLVVSLLGSFTVTILSFVLPPVLHLLIVIKPRMDYIREEEDGSASPVDHVGSAGDFLQITYGSMIRLQFYGDLFMALCGCVGCIFTTIITAIDAYQHFITLGHC